MDHQVNAVEIDMYIVLFAIFILHSRESELYRYTLDGKSALAWELPWELHEGSNVSNFAIDFKIFNILVDCFLFSSSSRAAKARTFLHLKWMDI